MNTSKIPVIIEGKTFIMKYDKGEFLINPLHDTDNSNGLSQYLNAYIPQTHRVEEDSEEKGFFSHIFNNSNRVHINIAKRINEALVDSQTVRVKKGNVYLVTDGQFTKIGGTTNNLQKRINELQTGNPRKLSLTGCYSVSYLLQSERMLQEMYRNKNVLNEWFDLSIDDIDFILHKKPSYSDVSKPKLLSHLSMINIMAAQWESLSNEYDRKVKLHNRQLSKLRVLVPSREVFSKLEKMKDKAVSEKYLSKYDSEAQLNIINAVKRYKRELQSIDNYMKFLQVEQIEYMDKHQFFYDDDNCVYRYEDLSLIEGEVYSHESEIA